MFNTTIYIYIDKFATEIISSASRLSNQTYPVDRIKWYLRWSLSSILIDDIAMTDTEAIRVHHGLPQLNNLSRTRIHIPNWTTPLLNPLDNSIQAHITQMIVVVTHILTFHNPTQPRIYQPPQKTLTPTLEMISCTLIARVEGRPFVSVVWNARIFCLAFLIGT